MSLPDPLNDNDGALPAEVTQAFLDGLQELALELEPSARSRVMGFMHLATDPARVAAHLTVRPDGEVRLVLVQSTAG